MMMVERGTNKQRNSLEGWIFQKIGGREEGLTREQIEEYQLEKVRETIHHAYENSPFYRRLFKDFIHKRIHSLEDLQYFPFTTGEQIREQALQFLCVSQSCISRVVTLDSSGTTGQEKRIYFTTMDQELTIDFFEHGMATMINPGDRVLILLPGERRGSVGELLARGIERIGATPILHGVITKLEEALEKLETENIDCVVGIPVQVLALARYGEFLEKKIQLKNVLLSTDYVPKAIVGELAKLWGCQVFEHYGMTEMGLGGGLDCEIHQGYHLREADLYIEIIDKQGNNVPDGQEGEVVVTTLTRQGMPLIRYRTGDISRFLPQPCFCGTVLKSLAKIKKRKTNEIFLSEKQGFTIAELDEQLFSVPSVLDYTADLISLDTGITLKVTIWMFGTVHSANEEIFYERLKEVPIIRQSQELGKLYIKVQISFYTGALLPPPRKRTIRELTQADGETENLFS